MLKVRMNDDSDEQTGKVVGGGALSMVYVVEYDRGSRYLWRRDAYRL